MLPEEDYVDYSDSELDMEDDTPEAPPAVNTTIESAAKAFQSTDTHSHTKAPVSANAVSKEPVRHYRPIGFKAARKEPNIAQRKSYGADLYKLQHQLRVADEKAKEAKREAARRQKEAAEELEKEKVEAEAMARHKKMVEAYSLIHELDDRKHSSDRATIGADIAAALADFELDKNMTKHD